MNLHSDDLDATLFLDNVKVHCNADRNGISHAYHACEATCSDDPLCKSYVFSDGTCYLDPSVIFTGDQHGPMSVSKTVERELHLNHRHHQCDVPPQQDYAAQMRRTTTYSRQCQRGLDGKKFELVTPGQFGRQEADMVVELKYDKGGSGFKSYDNLHTCYPPSDYRTCTSQNLSPLSNIATFPPSETFTKVFNRPAIGHVNSNGVDGNPKVMINTNGKGREFAFWNQQFNGNQIRVTVYAVEDAIVNFHNNIKSDEVRATNDDRYTMLKMNKGQIAVVHQTSVRPGGVKILSTGDIAVAMNNHQNTMTNYQQLLPASDEIWVSPSRYTNFMAPNNVPLRDDLWSGQFSTRCSNSGALSGSSEFGMFFNNVARESWTMGRAN